MKKMKRAALAMASVTAISLVGCGGSNTTTTADTKAAGESSAEGGNSGDISGNITFSWWGGDSRHEATEKAPSLTVKFIKTPLKALFYLGFSAVSFRFTI